MTIIDTFTDKNLLRSQFPNLATWESWWTFVKVIYGLPLEAKGLEQFQHHTGRKEPRAGGYPEGVCIVGCQSGKSQVAANVAVSEAINAVLAKLRGVFVVLLAQDLRGAQRTLFNYVKEAVTHSPVLAHEVIRETADSLELTGGITLAVYPCRPASIRGIRAQCIIIDELAFFIATDGRPTDTEMLRAARSRVAMTGGKVLILSSPYAASGALWELHRKHFAREESSTLIWQASAVDMNPTLPADYLERMKENDFEAYRSEVLGEFRQGISALFDPEALEACVDSGVRERAPMAQVRYTSFTDVASGTGSDAFSVAVAHLDGDRTVLDCVRTWKPPFNPGEVIAEAATVLKMYHCWETCGDRYAPGFVTEHFQAHRIHYRQSERDRSTIYLDLLPMVNAGQAVLLDRPDLLRELRGLERRRGTAGRDRIDHRSRSHDDTANACAGALTLASSVKMQVGHMVPIIASGGSRRS